MNSKQQDQATQIIQKVFQLLDEERIQKQIDEPIEQAVKQFQFHSETPPTRQEFHRILGDFVRRLYEFGLPLRQTLSASQALNEAVAILQHGYVSQSAQGYEAALLDCKYPHQNGIEFVLRQMAEAVKAGERQKYFNWIFARYIDTLDWQMKCRIAEMLLQRGKDFLPPELLHCPPAQFADHCRALFQFYLKTETLYRQIATPSIF